jgi:NAD(P)-dependent dehydrogenase (short-subunit alcohol dehydrogenase family)
MSDRPVALVTGASRGIGRAIAISLAAQGFHVVITGRTVDEGTAVNPANGNSLPGSLTSTMSTITAAGGTGRVIRHDVLDLERSTEPVDDVFAREGRLDVLVNNAVYVGPGNDALFVDNDAADIIRRVTGNLTSPLLITRRFVERALEQEPHPRLGSPGWVVGITSDAGRRTPERLAGNGGWSLVYAATKAGFHRIADMVAHEYGHRGIRAVNINPGLVATERVLDSGTSLAWIAEHGVRPFVIGEAVVRLLRDPLIGNGAYVHAQEYLREAMGDENYQEFVDHEPEGHS